MSGLFITLRNGLRSLSNFQTGIATVNDNVSNVNTPGYTRKRAFFAPTNARLFPFGVVGGGAEVTRIEGVRNSFLEKRLVIERQRLGFFEGQQFGLQQLESIVFQSDSSGISGQITRFFNSFSELTSDPASLPLRQQVLAEGSRLTREFNQAAERVGELVVENRQLIADSVDRINNLTSEIAKLNGEIQPFATAGQDAGALQDRQRALLGELSELVDFREFADENGQVSVVTANGNALVQKNTSNELSARLTSTGAEIFVSGRDVTAEIEGGRLGGYLRLDRVVLPEKREQLNQLAEELATQINAVHATGQDLNGAGGQPLFSFGSGSAALSLSINITDPAELAAASPGGGVGDGTVAQELADLRDQTFASLGDDSFQGFFSQIVFGIGLEGRDAERGISSQSAILGQVQLQRDSVSGVSLDEEAVRLIQFQRAYEANSRLIQVVNQLLEETINLIR